MQIVLNHVTRMRHPRICIAGIDVASGRHVRPTTAMSEPLTRELLASEGGFVECGAVIDIGDAQPHPVVPEVEDRHCSLRELRAVRRLNGTQYLELLERVADDDLEDVFGPDLYRPSKWRYAVDAGCGSASLGVLRAERPELSIDAYERPTLRLSAPELPAYARVTDVRFFAGDQVQVREDVVEDVQRRLERGVRAFAMVGLSRAFADDAGHERHWLQVNGICLEDRPLGERP
jgi:hypothetical protein